MKENETPFRFDPVTGKPNPHPVLAGEYRAFHGRVAWLFNPWTGTARDPRDIGSDTFGHAIVPTSDEDFDFIQTLMDVVTEPRPNSIYVASYGPDAKPRHSYSTSTSPDGVEESSLMTNFLELERAARLRDVWFKPHVIGGVTIHSNAPAPKEHDGHQ